MALAEILIGLVAGLVSTTVMSLAEYEVWCRWGMEAVSEWHMNQVIAGRLLGRSPEAALAPGLLLHLLHGGLAGIVFVLFFPIFPRIPVIAAGVGFGLVLWIIALLLMKPVTGISIRSHQFKRLAFVVSLGGHILYGLLLGLAVMYL